MYEIVIAPEAFEQKGQEQPVYSPFFQCLSIYLERLNTINSGDSLTTIENINIEMARGENYAFDDELKKRVRNGETLTPEIMREHLKNKYDCKTREEQDRVIHFFIQHSGGFAYQQGEIVKHLLQDVGEAESFAPSGENNFSIARVEGGIQISCKNKLALKVPNEPTTPAEVEASVLLKDDDTFSLSPVKINIEETAYAKKNWLPKIEANLGYQRKTNPWKLAAGIGIPSTVVVYALAITAAVLFPAVGLPLLAACILGSALGGLGAWFAAKQTPAAPLNIDGSELSHYQETARGQAQEKECIRVATARAANAARKTQQAKSSDYIISAALGSSRPAQQPRNERVRTMIVAPAGPLCTSRRMTQRIKSTSAIDTQEQRPPRPQ